MLAVVGFFRVFRVFRGSKGLEIFGKVLTIWGLGPWGQEPGKYKFFSNLAFP